MPIRVKTDHGIVEFPDGTAPDVMTTALQSLNAPDRMSPIEARSQLNAQEKEPTISAGRADTLGNTIKGYFTKMADDMAGSAHPTSLSDIATLLVPSELGMGDKGFGGAARNLLHSGQEASALEPTKAGKLTAFLKGLTRAATEDTTSGEREFQRMPLAKQMDALPATASPMRKIVPPPQSDAGFKDLPLWQQMEEMTKPAVTPEMRQGGAPFAVKPKAPASLEDELMSALQEARAQKPPAPTSGVELPSTPPDMPGVQKPRPAKGRQGGYTTGNPPKPSIPEVSDARAQELLSKFEGTGPVEPPPTLDSLVQGDVKQKLSAPEVAQRLRDEYGSRDGGRMLYGDSLPGAERQDAIRRLAPGPSRTPNAATERINAADAKGAIDRDTDPKDILGLLVAALGGGTLASHATTPTMGGTP